MALVLPQPRIWQGVTEWAAHLRKSASGGHLRKTLTGHLSKGCAILPGDPCGHCDDSTPAEMIVVSSGISWIPGCCLHFDDPAPTQTQYVDIAETPSVSPNGTWLLTQTANPCVWLDKEACTGRIELFRNASCTLTLSPPSSFTLFEILVIVTVAV